MTTENYLSLLTLILGVGTAISPVVFGYILWRMSREFVTKEQFEEFKRDRHEAAVELNDRLKSMEADIKTLLRRVGE